MPPKEKRFIDSIQNIISKCKNDTAIIFYESKKDEVVHLFTPEESLKKGKELLKKAFDIKHHNSVARAYTIYERSFMALAGREENIAKREKLLERADSLIERHGKYILDNYTNISRIKHYAWLSNYYNYLSEHSEKKKDHYFNKRVQFVNTLLNKYDLKKYPETYMDIYFGLAVIHQNHLKTPEAVRYYLEIAKFADSLRYYDRAIEYYNNLGFTYFADGNFGSAQRYYFLSLKCTEKFPADSFTVSERHKDRIGNKGITLANIANVLYLQKNYQQAVDYFKKSLPYFIDAGAHEFLCSMVARVGNIYANMNQLDSAEAYLLKEKKLTSLLSDKNQLIKHDIRIKSLKAFIHSQKKQYREAIVLAQEAVRLSEQLGDVNGTSQAYESLGNYYVLNNEVHKGILYYNKQLGFRSNWKGWREKTLSKIYVNKAKAFIKLKNADSAIYCLQEAKTLVEKVNVKLEMNAVYQNLAEAYILANNMPEAVTYLKKHIQYKDSITGDQVTQQVTSIALKYEEDVKLLAEKTIREKQRLESEKKIEEQAQQRRILMIVVVSVSLLVVVAGFSIFKIKKANVLLKEQKQEIEEQRNLVTHQKHVVEEKNKEITDSIQYAKRIQTALIHTQPHLEGNFKDHFVFFKPKDIVSGDFYWSALQNEHLYVAACDCTGHGVPGAFMSLLNISFLNEAIIQKKLIEPNKVFDFVKQNLVTNLSFDGSKDGMDACLLHVNKNTKTITYSAANNKPVIIRDNELIELPCDKMPVGKSYSENNFTLYTIDYMANDILYLFTDGYKDQFGGKENKKLNSKMFKKLLLEFSRFDFATQKEKIKDFFNEWRGNVEQTDDVCVIGLKL